MATELAHAGEAAGMPFVLVLATCARTRLAKIRAATGLNAGEPNHGGADLPFDLRLSQQIPEGPRCRAIADSDRSGEQ